MHKTHAPRFAIAAALLLAVAGALATPKASLRVQDACPPAPAPVAPVAGGFLTVVNDGDKPDVLLGAESDLSQRVELHEMRMDDGMMRMRELTDGLPVPARGKVVLAPGGYHLMFIKPKRALVEGERFTATLRFRDAGKVSVTFTVRGMGAGAH